MIRVFSLLSVAFAVAACSTATAPSSDLITATPGAQSLVLANTSSGTVYYFAADRGTLALLDFTHCNEPSKCASVAAGATIELPYSGILGYENGTGEIVVHHWRLVGKGAGTFEPDSIRTLVVRVS